MMNFPKLYLLLRLPNCEWEVRIYPDLETALSRWNSRSDPQSVAGVLHIGVMAPSAGNFDGVADSFPGLLLLTSAAKHALPSSYPISSSPIQFDEEMEVYIALGRWGCSPGYPAAVIGKHPDEVSGETLLLGDEFRNESKTQAQKTGLTKSKSADARVVDPCLVAQTAPPWLAEMKLITLDIPVYVTNRLGRAHIEKVGDLAKMSASKLLALPGIGRKRLNDILRALEQVLVRGPPQIESPIHIGSQGTLLEEIKWSMRLLSPHWKDIFVKRLGLGVPAETLQQIGKSIGKTRERVRQVETKLFKMWMPSCSWHSSFKRKIAWIHLGQSQALTFSEMEGIDGWFKGMTTNQEFFRSLIRSTCNKEFNVIVVEGNYCICHLTQEDWEQVARDASGLLSSAQGKGWTEEYARYRVQKLLPVNAQELGDLLWKKSMSSCHFARADGGERILVAYGHGAVPLVKFLLSVSDSPMHYTVIAERINQKYGRKIDAWKAHLAAAQVGLLFSPGTFGVARHIPFSDERMAWICAEAEEIVCSGDPGRQWHSSEILSEMMEYIGSGFEALDKYIVDIALTKSSMVRSLRRMVWVPSSQNDEGQARINIHEATVSIIELAGKPLSTHEIKKRLTEERGINNTVCIHLKPPLVRLEPGVFGIFARDYPLSSDEQARLVEKAILALEKRQSGLHLSELSEALPLAHCPPFAFFSQAAQDDRLEITSMTRYLYLAKWKSPRRETINSALRKTLENENESLTTSELVTSVRNLLRRDCNVRTIMGGLRALEAQYDRNTQTWSLKRAQSPTTEKERKPEIS